MRRPAVKLRKLLGSNVRRVRLEMGWSQEELAARARLSQSYLSQLESGLRSVSIDTIDQVARALSIGPDVLLRPSPPDQL